MEEARASLNFFGITRKGWNVQFTLRDDDEMALMERFAKLSGWLEEHHVAPKPVGNQPTSAPPTHRDAPGQAQSPPPTSSVPPPAAAQHEGSLSFEAESLVGSTSEGKTYWKVRGGMFKKFGVTIWPEVLTKAGFDMEELNPATSYNLIGYTATYLLNAEKSTPEKEVPDKVVALHK